MDGLKGRIHPRGLVGEFLSPKSKRMRAHCLLQLHTRRDFCSISYSPCSCKVPVCFLYTKGRGTLVSNNRSKTHTQQSIFSPLKIKTIVEPLDVGLWEKQENVSNDHLPFIRWNPTTDGNFFFSNSSAFFFFLFLRWTVCVSCVRRRWSHRWVRHCPLEHAKIHGSSEGEQGRKSETNNKKVHFERLSFLGSGPCRR